jgi:hypothetical protein
MKIKKCSHCHKQKPLNQFGKMTYASSGKSPWCKMCMLKHIQDWRKNNPTRQNKWWHNPKQIQLRVFTGTRNAAKRRKIPFFLDRQWVNEKIKKGCAVTGQLFDLSSASRGPFGPSIDRKDSRKGYTKRNCQMVFLIYNYAKNKFKHVDVLKLAETLKQKTPDVISLGVWTRTSQPTRARRNMASSPQ